eukprot:jgi/Hompol1/2583/HPOL_001427-RA
MITVHHLNNSRSQRILWLLEELALPYSIKKYERVNGLAPPELMKVHPLGKSPVISDDATGMTVAESGAIVEYLVEKTGQLVPEPKTRERLQYTYWLHFAEGSAMMPLLLKLIFTTITARTPWPVRPIIGAVLGTAEARIVTPNVSRHFEFIEKHLEKNEFFCGSEFSAADIQMSFPVEAATMRLPEFVGPRTAEWLRRVRDRPAYRRALENGGPYSFGPSE